MSRAWGDWVRRGRTWHRVAVVMGNVVETECGRSDIFGSVGSIWALTGWTEFAHGPRPSGTDPICRTCLAAVHAGERRARAAASLGDTPDPNQGGK